MDRKKPFIYYFSIFLLLMTVIASMIVLFVLDHKLEEEEAQLRRMKQQYSLIEEDNKILEKQIDEITEHIEGYEQDERYEGLELWKKLREQLKEQSSS